MTQLYAVVFGEVIELDLIEGFNISISKKYKDLKNLTGATIPRSLTITLPNTATNKIVFDNYQRPELIGSVNFTTNIKADLLINGVPLLKGTMQILKHNISANTLDVVLYDRTINAFDILKNETMDSLDFSDLDHNINATNITASWTGGLHSGKVVYPLTDNGEGFGYPNPTAPSTARNIRTSGQGIKSLFQVPAFNVKEIFSRLFSDIVTRVGLSGWTFDELNNLDADLFYINNIKPEEGQTAPIDLVSYGELTEIYEFEINTGSTRALKLYSKIDTANMLSAYKVTALHTGNYKFDLRGVVFWDMLKHINITGCKIEVYKNGAATGIKTDLGYTTSIDTSLTVGATTGDILEFKFVNNSGVTKYINTVSINVTITAVGSAGTPILSGICYANNYFRTNKAEFLKDFIKMYNLVVYIDEATNYLKLVPYTDFIASGSAIDYTGKVLLDGYSIAPPYDAMYKNINLSFKESKDYNNKLYKEVNNLDFGGLKIASNIPFLTEDLNAEVSFSPYNRVQLQDSVFGVNTISNLYGIKNNNSPYDVKGEAWGEKYLAYYEGIATTSLNYYIDTTLVTTAPLFSNYLLSGGQVVTSSRDLSFIYTMPPPKGGYIFNSSFDSANSSSFWNRYYKPYFDLIYNSNNKIVECELLMTPLEFYEINLNNTLLIEGVNYIILELIYNSSKQTAKAKLLTKNS